MPVNKSAICRYRIIAETLEHYAPNPVSIRKLQSKIVDGTGQRVCISTI